MRSPRRAGFTLLEMVLAVSITMLLLTAMYWLYSTQLQSAQAGREKLAEITLARSILTRLSADIVTQLGAYDPRVLPASASSTTPPSSEAAPAEESTTPGTAETTMPDASMSAGPSTTGTTVNLGVYGEANRLVLTVSRVPRAAAANTNAATPVASDLRRITYWTVGAATDAQGLARQDLTRVTGDEASTLPPNGVDEARLIIAPEVASITFEYFDGVSWQESWDGMAPGPDGDTPLGPPSAIAITITLRLPGATATEEESRPRYRHVVALPTANSPSDAP